MLGTTEQDIFGEEQTSAETERLIRVVFGLPINWVGNKKRMLRRLVSILCDGRIGDGQFLDVFSGSGVVSMLAAASGRRTHSNDLLVLSSTWLLHALSGRPNPLTMHDYVSLAEAMSDVGPPRRLAFLGELYGGSVVSPEELSRMDSFRRAVEALFGRRMSVGLRLDGNVLRPAYLDLSDGSSSFVPGPGWPDKAAFAMQMMCVHILQQAFMGGRCYKSQLLAIHDKRLREGRIRKDGSNVGLIGDADRLLPLLRPSTCPTNELASILAAKGASASVSNCDAEELVSSGSIDAEVAYFDPPYGGHNSDYAWMYRVCEEFLTGVRLEDNRALREASVKFKGNDYERDKEFEKIQRMGYIDNLSSLLAVSKRFPVWVISFNESSFMPIRDIVDVVASFRGDPVVEAADGYRYNYRDRDAKHGSEYVILARGS
jgi:16S rRNA G966 N2-methylase RsmD